MLASIFRPNFKNSDIATLTGRSSPAIIDKVNREIEAVQKSPEVQKQFANEGATPEPMKPADFGSFMVSEMNKWEKVVKQGGIKAE